MSYWFQSSEDPREVFPIENLPIETWGEENRDALTLLYQQKRLQQNLEGKAHPSLMQRGIDKEKEVFFKRALPILDGFDNIFKHANAQNIEGDEILANWLKTMETLYRRLQSALEKEGLVAIESIGKPLDLSKQEVVDTREVTNIPNNTVFDEIVKGYMYGNRVLRDAKVIVVKNSGNGKNSAGYEEIAPPDYSVSDESTLFDDTEDNFVEENNR